MSRARKILGRLLVVATLFVTLPAAKCAPAAKTVTADAAGKALACEAASPNPLDQATLQRCAEEAGFSAAADVLELLVRAEAAHKALAARGFTVPAADGGAP